MTILEKAKQETQFLHSGDKFGFRHYYAKGANWVLDEIEKIVNSSTTIDEIKVKLKKLKKNDV